MATANAFRTMPIPRSRSCRRWILSGYVQPLVAKMPKQGSKPRGGSTRTTARHLTLRFGKVDDGVMQYSLRAMVPNG